MGQGAGVFRLEAEIWGLMPSKIGRLRQLADLSLDQDGLQKVIRKKL